MSRRKKGGDEGGVEMETGGMMRWLLTYADMLTLLFALFIILYSMSMTNQQSFSKLAEAFRQQFGVMPGGAELLKSVGGDVPGFAMVPGVGDQRGGGGDPEKIRRRLEGLEGVTLREDERAITISIQAEGLLFLRGEAELLPGVRKLLDPVVEVLRQTKEAVMVEGHTCDLPVHGTVYPSNWELSTGRAARVVRYLVERGVDPKILAAGGYGESRPIAPNTDENHRKLNRRVDIVIMKERLPVVPPPGPPKLP